MELLGAGLAAEVPGDVVDQLGDAFLAHLVAVVTGDALQTQTSRKALFEQQLTAWAGTEDGHERAHITTHTHTHTHTHTRGLHIHKSRTMFPKSVVDVSVETENGKNYLSIS